MSAAIHATSGSTEQEVMGFGPEAKEFPEPRSSAENKEDSSPSSSSLFWCRLYPHNSALEVFSFMSLIFVGVGAILVFIGYLYPRDYVRNPEISAREEEAIEAYYSDLALNLDRTILAGFAFITAGAILMAIAITLVSIDGMCGRPESEPLIDTEMEDIRDDVIKDYGSRNVPYLPLQ